MFRPYKLKSTNLIFFVLISFNVWNAVMNNLIIEPVDLVIDYYSIQGIGASYDYVHQPSTCEKKDEGCRLRFDFRRCPLKNVANQPNCSYASIETETKTGCYSCTVDLSYCNSSTADEYCRLSTRIEGSGSTYQVRVVERRKDEGDFTLAIFDAVQVGKGYIISETFCEDYKECGLMMFGLLQSPIAEIH